MKGKSYRSTTSNPAMIRHRMKSPVWRMIRKPSLNKRGWKLTNLRHHFARDRARPWEYRAGEIDKDTWAKEQQRRQALSPISIRFLFTQFS
jgi:hypothetical protein